MSYGGDIAHSEQSAASSGTPITDADGAYFVVAVNFRTGAEKYAGLNGVQAVSKMAQLSLDPENRFIRYDYRANRSVREAMTHALRFFAAGLALCMGTAGQADTVSERLDRLVRAYPRAIAGHDERYLYWRDGTRMSVGEPEERKSFDDLLRRASILDQLSLSYPQGDSKPPAVNADPGRFRNEAFFKKMYGDCSRGEVSANLVSIVWLPRTWGESIRVTRMNGVADRLKQVSEEIDALDPAIKRAAYPIAGVFSCRPVAIREP